MSSTYTTNIGLERPATGDYVNTWSTPVNADWSLIDQALGSTTSQAFTNANITFTVAQSAYFMVTCTGALTANVQLIFPSTIGGRRIINNTCTGAFTLTVLNGAGDTGGGVVMPQASLTPVLLTAGRAYIDVPPLTIGQLPAIGTKTVIGNATGGTAVPTALSQVSLTALINAFTASLSGAVPLSGGGVVNFLRADGSWAALATSSTAYAPQGRLTLTSGTPVLSGAVSAASTIYYTPYIGQLIPIWNGTNFIPTIFAETSQALSDTTLSPAAAVSGSAYDLFAWSNSGTVVVTRGPVWSSLTARSAGTVIARVQGVLVNSVGVTNGPGAGAGTYVGTIATDAGGATVTYNPTPAAASAGPTNGAWVGIWNQYNRVLVSLSAQDNKTSWAYNTATWRASDGSNNNRITVVSGTSGDFISVTFLDSLTQTGSGSAIGIGVNSTTTPSGGGGGVQGGTSSYAITTQYTGIAPLGETYFQAIEIGNGSASTFYGAQASPVSQLMQISAQFRY